MTQVFAARRRHQRENPARWQQTSEVAGTCVENVMLELKIRFLMGIITERCLEAFHQTHLPFTLTSASPVNMSQMTVNQ